MPLKKNIINELRNAIIRGDYKPGDRLTEAGLCQRFEVSRTPIREALNQLEKEGFIVMIPNVGAKIKKLTPQDLTHIFDILIFLEGAACNLSALKFDDAGIIKLEENIVMMERAINQNNLDLLYELNTQFHWLITERTDNPYLINMRSNLRDLIEYFGRMNALIPGQLDATLRDHRKIIDAIKLRNPVLAEIVARDHMEFSKKGLLEYLKEFLA
ncbi:MAG: GntR family transcriptional regulator [Nitrospirota bacterium]